MAGQFWRSGRLWLAALALVAVATTAPAAHALSQQEEMVERSVLTLRKLADREDIRPHLLHYLKSAKGVLIMPQILKAGFFVGGEGGSGVLLAKGNDGRWSYPAFYTMGAASIGLQFGGQSMESILIIMTPKGLSAVLEDKVKIGAELSAAVGPHGVGIEGATSAALGADIISYSITKGAFIGGAFEGAIIEQRDSLNYEFYESTKATPRAIVFEGQFANPAADRLRETLATLGN